MNLIKNNTNKIYSYVPRHIANLLGDISAFSKNRTICVQVPFKTCVKKFVGLLSDDSIASLSKTIMEAYAMPCWAMPSCGGVMSIMLSHAMLCHAGPCRHAAV